MIPLTKEQALEELEITKEWEKVFGGIPEGLDIMVGPDKFPLLRECLKLKSTAPLDAFIEEEVASGKIF